VKQVVYIQARDKWIESFSSQTSEETVELLKITNDRPYSPLKDKWISRIAKYTNEAIVP
jgi:hypothetical protein